MSDIRNLLQRAAIVPHDGAIVPHDGDAAPLQLPSEDLSLVSNLDDEFRWAEHNMNVIGDGDVDSLHAFLNESHSSAFSGISSDQVAKNTWHANCEAHCCQPIPHGEYTAAIEWNHHAADELICLPFGPSCVFSDVLDFAMPQVKSCALASVECGQASFDSLASLFFAKGAVGQHAPCRRHGKHCCFKRCKGNVSGSPCTDFSSMGTKHGECGPTTMFFLCWAALMRIVAPHWILAENVEAFPVRLLKIAFGHMYEIHTHIFSNVDFGKAGRRVRRYSLMTLRTIVRLTRELSDCTVLFGRRRAKEHTWRNYFTASIAEQIAELRWAYQRPTIDASSCLPLDGATELSSAHFHAGLTKFEQERLELYKRDFDAANCVVSLNQNPEEQATTSTTDELHTVIRNCHLLWSEVHGRWLTGRECLLTQGVPTTNSSLAACQRRSSSKRPMSSFNVLRRDFNLGNRLRTEMAHQAGNMMSVQVIGSIQMFMGMYIKRDITLPSPCRPLVPSRMLMTPPSSTSTDMKRSQSGMSTSSSNEDSGTPGSANDCKPKRKKLSLGDWESLRRNIIR